MTEKADLLLNTNNNNVGYKQQQQQPEMAQMELVSFVIFWFIYSPQPTPLNHYKLRVLKKGFSSFYYKILLLYLSCRCFDLLIFHIWLILLMLMFSISMKEFINKRLNGRIRNGKRSGNLYKCEKMFRFRGYPFVLRKWRIWPKSGYSVCYCLKILSHKLLLLMPIWFRK